MRILHISSAQNLGGGERHLADLANGLAAGGHAIHVALRPNSPLTGELSRIPVHHITTLPLRNSLDAPSARGLSRVVREKQIQIIHAHMARDYPLAAYAARANPSSRLIVTRHVLFPLNRLHRVTLSQAARIIAVSQAVATQLRADRIAPPEKISVVLNGIDAARFRKAKEQFNRQDFIRNWNLPEDALLVGTVGELTPLKGHQDFLQAAAQLIKQCPAAYFIIAGVDSSPGEKSRAHLEQLIYELKLSERVKLTGWLDDLAQLHCALDVFVSASHTESFGLAIAEAMASGTAVVATETDGAQEILQAGKTGLLVPVGDVDQLAKSILELLEEQDSRVRLGRAAQKAVAAQFNVERMIDETEEIYRAAIQQI